MPDRRISKEWEKHEESDHPDKYPSNTRVVHGRRLKSEWVPLAEDAKHSPPSLAKKGEPVG
jgi:hypothetical protein